MASNDELGSGDNENLCVVCFKDVEIYSVGICDHPVCFECSTRMRVLCCQNECPICRGLMPKVIFTNEVANFANLYAQHQLTNLQDRKYGLLFASYDIQKAYQKLLENRCNVCKDIRKFPHFQQLKDHMRREHGLSYCDLCVENLKIFSYERRAYTRQELGYHRRKGDPDNTSHRGHPLCEFCDTRFMDLDELFRHLRRNHLFCHFCDADGKHQYYNSMEDLRRHFQEEHYLCEEGECRTMPLVGVFRTEIDLKAHIATEHSRSLSKSATKQARTLEVEFTLAPRARNDRNKRTLRLDNNRSDEEGAVGYNLEPSLRPQDFPALGNSTVSSVSVQGRPASVNFTTSKVREDFPSLGPSRSSAVTITNSAPIRKKDGPEVTITRTVKSQQALERTKENFPTLSSSSSLNPPTTSTVRLSVNNTTPKVSIHVNHNGAITTHITSSASTANNTEAFPALGSGKAPVPTTQPLWVSQKTKPKVEQKTKIAPAPQLPPSDLSQFPTLKANGNNKKSSSVTVPVTTNWVNNEIKDDGKNKKKKKKASNNNNNNNNNSALNQPSTSLVENEKNLNNNNEINGIIKKRSELKIGNLTLNEPQTSTNNSAKPPPGFPTKPPPGLNSTNFPALGNDLTFTNSSGQSYAIKPSNTYHQPSNFSTRNQNLIKNLLAMINSDLIKEFKKYSDLFRNGKLLAESYYGHCRSVMGEKFEEFLPELLVLLPDITKQQELYKVYSGRNKDKLIICEKCKQVIFKNELTEHYGYHTLDNNFPTLAKSDGFNAWKK